MKRLGWFVCAGIICAAIAGCGGGGGGMVKAPGLGLSAMTESFVGTTGAAAKIPPAMVNVTNTGGGTLNFTAASDSPWLMVSPANGTAPQALTITAVVGALTPSNNTGHITVTATGAQNSPGTVTVTFIVAPVAANTPVWPQWGANPQHSGMLGGIAGQNVTTKHADIVYYPFINQEKAENAPLFSGEAALTVHDQAPITDGVNNGVNDVYMVMKTGSYNSCNPAGSWWTNGAACGPNTWNTMVWNEARFSWINGTLTQISQWPSDWVPEPNAANIQQNFPGLEGWEPVFHPVDANGFIYAPGAQGAIWKLNKADGSVKSHIMPSFSGANVTPANTFVSSPLAADAQGNIYYNVIAVNTTGGNPWGQNDVAGAWLVKVAPPSGNDAVTMATYASLVPGAPAGNSLNCPGTFFNANPVPPFPWPPTGQSAPTFPAPCGSQRPGVNIAPAVGADGTIFTVSVAHFDNMVAYVVAVNPDLTPKWQASLQNRLNDGCGVLSYGGQIVLPIAGAGVTNLANSCLFGTNQGVDPTTNAMGSGTIVDEASSSPTVLPDGSVVFGATDNYNFGRGHLFHFGPTGNFINAYNFGWDSTPAAYTHGGTFSVIIKDNHYDASAYCRGVNPVCTPRQPGPYYIT